MSSVSVAAVSYSDGALIIYITTNTSSFFLHVIMNSATDWPLSYRTERFFFLESNNYVKPYHFRPKFSYMLYFFPWPLLCKCEYAMNLQYKI